MEKAPGGRTSRNNGTYCSNDVDDFIDAAL